MTALNEAPALPAPKQQVKYIKLDPMPKSGSFVMTLVASNFIPNYESIDPKTKIKKVFDAVELFFGAVIGGKPYFVKTYPSAFSAHEKAKYAQAVVALTGSLPESGSKPSDFYGKAAMVSVVNENKVSQKGTQYVRSKIKGFIPVPEEMLSSATPLAALKDALAAKLAEGSGDSHGEQPAGEDSPF